MFKWIKPTLPQVKIKAHVKVSAFFFITDITVNLNFGCLDFDQICY